MKLLLKILYEEYISFYFINLTLSIKKTRILISEMKKLNFNIFNIKGMIVKKMMIFLHFQENLFNFLQNYCVFIINSYVLIR